MMYVRSAAMNTFLTHRSNLRRQIILHHITSNYIILHTHARTHTHKMR